MKNRYRLDRSIGPLTYDILLTPDLKHFTFTGRETIRLRTHAAFSRVTLHAIELKIEKAAIRNRRDSAFLGVTGVHALALGNGFSGMATLGSTAVAAGITSVNASMSLGGSPRTPLRSGNALTDWTIRSAESGRRGASRNVTSRSTST